jgi:hypothetical protein
MAAVKIEFVRAGDRYFTEVERDDGAVVRLRGPGARGLPHDLVHYVVESELRVDRGFWGKVARGENVGKVEYVRAPSRRVRPLKHAPRGKGGDVEAIVGLVQRIHTTLQEKTPSAVGDYLDSSLTPALRERAGLDPTAVLRMCRRLDHLGGKWSKLRNGGRLVLDWPPRAARV